MLIGFLALIALYSCIAWVLARPSIDPLVSDPYRAVQLPYETVSFPSEYQGLPLEGWYIPAAEPSSRTIVFSHGYGGNREEIWVPIYELARIAHEAGYNSLMFDYGYVYHADRVVTGGPQESGDLLGAVQFAKERGAEQVIIWGFSMGAGTALQAALRTDQIDAMILDSTFVLDPDTLYHNLQPYVPNLPRELTLALLQRLYPLLNGTGIEAVPYEEVKAAVYPIPILMIHGTADERSPAESIASIAANQTAHAASDFWLVPDATHELVYRSDKEAYTQRVLKFLRRIGPSYRSSADHIL
jgi:alpha-beta hydrolase superfamily lysophospholipase